MMEMFVMDDCRMAANDVVINNQVLRLVINLDRSPKRLELISKQLADQSLSFERFPAVDGHKLTKEELSRLEAPYNAPEKFVFRKALWPNEIACFLSHAACWEKLVKSDCEWGLIILFCRFVSSCSRCLQNGFLKEYALFSFTVHINHLLSEKVILFAIRNYLGF